MKIPQRFSLTEGLILVGVLGTVFCLLPPLLQQGREAADLAKCRANLHELGAAIHLYASENEGRLPYRPNIGPPVSPPQMELGSLIGDGRLYGQLLAKEAGGFSDRGYLSTPHPLFCPSLSPTVYAMDPAYKRPEEINQDNKIIRMGYIYVHKVDSYGPGISNETIYRLPNEPLCFDFGPNAIGPAGSVWRERSHAEVINVLHLGGHVATFSLEEVNQKGTTFMNLYNFLRGGAPPRQ